MVKPQSNPERLFQKDGFMGKAGSRGSSGPGEGRNRGFSLFFSLLLSLLKKTHFPGREDYELAGKISHASPSLLNN